MGVGDGFEPCDWDGETAIAEGNVPGADGPTSEHAGRTITVHSNRKETVRGEPTRVRNSSVTHLGVRLDCTMSIISEMSAALARGLSSDPHARVDG